MNETRELARHVTEVEFERLPKAVIDKAKQLVLDQLGCEIGCSTRPWSKIVCDYAAGRVPVKPESTILNYGLRTTAEDAAQVNATFGHGFEIDDTDLVSKIHPGCVVTPVALALGEKEGISGRDFITAVVVGYDVASRVGASAKLAIERGFHPTPVFGPFGAAAAAARILKLNADGVLNAFGIVASHCSGLMEYTETGGEVKRIHAGIAAHAGIKAARLAQRGLTGPATALEGKKGLCQAFSDTTDLAQITDSLGKEYRIMWTGLKPYCCCAGQHAALDAAELIASKHGVQPEQIEEIVVGSGPMEVRAVGVIVEPRDIAGMQFSGRFGIALRLLKGGNGTSEYTESNLWDPAVRSFAKKISWTHDQDVEKTTEAGARVTMKLKDGRTLSEKVAWARGTIHNLMTDEEVKEKFARMTSVVLPGNRIEAIVDTVEHLDSLDNIRKLIALLVRE